MQKITPHLWFDREAEDAARLYASLFPDSAIGTVSRYGKTGQEVHGQPEGQAMTVPFTLAGYDMLGLNGGPHFRFTPAISFFVTLETEEAVNAIWSGLVADGTVLMPLDRYDWSEKYGWLSDRYGVSWQIALGDCAEVGHQAICPSLLFVGAQHGRAEAAMEHYMAVFSTSPAASSTAPTAVDGILRYDGGPDPAGTVKHAQFRLAGETFMAMDSAAAHDFGFTEAVSFMVGCDNQAEVDHYWSGLSAVPDAERCGWLKDRFGVSWQIVPRILPRLLADPDPARSARVMQAMLAMKKIDIEVLKAEHEGR
ncbi:VOC family protein [Fodinicurvata sp. EGI_FJ10296]|uniref:VOC family protein n=1 Tax=Fodinicurvata sp. EGI_FJ10296 TaxID=3231908 RepID=UPI00345426ED